MQLPSSSYLAEDTICAISTELGGAIVIVRVSGPRSFEALERLSGSEEVAFRSEPRKMTRVRLYKEKDTPLDDALVVRFKNPQSYTGEDMVEYHLHGGHFIANRLIESLLGQGLRQALPGEFSFRSVRNGKLSLFQAQAVADLIGASNEGAISLALEKLSGAQNNLLEQLANNLRKVAILGEVGIDFADQDIEEVSLPQLKKQLDPLIGFLDDLKNSYYRGFRLQEGLQVAFIGPPNAGKSSFFNCLLGEDRSIVSETAGTTRDVIKEKLTLRGSSSSVTLRLADTAGLRLTEDAVEKVGIERTHKTAQEADLILFIVDASAPLVDAMNKWNSLSQKLNQSLNAKTIGILTKCDLVNSTQIQSILQEVAPFGILNWVETSAYQRTGIREAINTLITFCETRIQHTPGELILTRLQHQTATAAALDHLYRAKTATEIDLFASDIRQALHSLNPLIGETLPDDILGKIFSDFCIGK